MEKQPPSLFYYGDQNLVNLLKKGSLALSNDWSMLDPYVSFDRYQQSLQQSITEAELIQGFQAEYQRLPDAIRGLLSFEDFLAQRDKIEPSVRQNILRSRTAADAPMKYQTSRIEQTLNLRLFSSATVPMAWQTLAEGFSGICLELGSKASGFQALAGKPVLLRPVRYGQTHDLSVSPDNPVPGVFEDIREHQANGEWRLVRPANQGGEIKLAKGDVVNVFVSVHASSEWVAKLREFLALDLRYRNCQLFEVYPDASTWRLTARPI